MPYRRTFKRRPYRRRRYKRRTGNGFKSAYQLAMTAWRGIRYLKGLVNAEMHTHDSSLTADPTAAGVVAHLSGVAQGDSNITRTGNSIFVRWVQIRGTLEIDSSATATCIRCILFVNKQQVADTTPGTTDLLATADVDSFLNKDNAGRFTVLHDRKYIVSNAGNRKRFITISRGMRMHVRFNGTASTDIQKNGIYFLIMCDEAVNVPQANLSARIGFHDN